jgi:hypothetical protein
MSLNFSPHNFEIIDHVYHNYLVFFWRLSSRGLSVDKMHAACVQELFTENNTFPEKLHSSGEWLFCLFR